MTPRGPQPALIICHRVKHPTAARPRARHTRTVRALRRIPPPRLGRAGQHTLQNLRLRTEQFAVRVERRVDHRPKGRRPRRTHRIAPPPSTRTALATYHLSALAGTPLLVLRQADTTDLIENRPRPIERGQLFRCVHVDETCDAASPADPAGNSEQSLLTGNVGDHRVSRWLPPKQRRRRGSHATHRRPRCYPDATRPVRTGRKSTVFGARLLSHSCAGFLPAQRDFSRSFATEPTEWRRRESNPRPRPHRQNVYERSPRFGFARRSVCGRPTDGLAILKSRALGDWLSRRAEPDCWRPVLSLGPS